MDLTNIERFNNELNRTSQDATIKAGQSFGFQGRVLGLNVYGSNNLKAGSSGNICGVYQRDAIQVAIQKKVTVERRQPHDKFADALRAWTLWGQTEARDKSGVQLNAR